MATFHLLCPRYSGPLIPTALRLLGHGKHFPLPLKYIALGVFISPPLSIVLQETAVNHAGREP